MSINFSQPLFVLAPLAGYTDLPFRRVAKKFGADLTVSEMISSNALVHNVSRTLKMIEKDPLEIPYAVQLAGNEPSVMAGAVEILNRFTGIDVIDLNCGCPATKIVGHGSGSSLLKDKQKMKAIIEAIKKTSTKPQTSVKIRIGYENKEGVALAQVCQEAGADFIAVHGRTRAGKFSAPVDYEEIKAIKAALSIPVIANGDIDSYDKAQWVLEYTQCDGIMIGRGAIGNPWIFHQLKTGKSDIEGDIKRQIVLEHFHAMVEFYGDYGVILFRKHLHTYSKGGREASNFRQQVNATQDPYQMQLLIENFFE